MIALQFLEIVCRSKNCLICNLSYIPFLYLYLYIGKTIKFFHYRGLLMPKCRSPPFFIRKKRIGKF